MVLDRTGTLERPVEQAMDVEVSGRPSQASDESRGLRPRDRGDETTAAVTRAGWLESLARTVSDARGLGVVELVVHTRAARGTVHACRGSIAWVVAGESTERLSSVLVRRTGLSFERLQQTYKQCQREGSNFGEALVESELLDRAEVAAALLEHNARQLLRLLDAEPSHIDVLPRRRDYTSELVFPIAELVEEMARLAGDDGKWMRANSDGLARESIDTDTQRKKYDMANIKQSLEEVLKLDGALAAALVDWESGLTLGTAGGNGIDIELAASGNTSVVRAKMAVMHQLGIPGVIEDILITLSSQYHLIRPLSSHPSLFLYVAIDKARGNLGHARHKLRQIEEVLVL